jgi:hypothetical protein
LVLSFNPVLWWQLDDVTDPADDFAAADNDGIKTGTLSFGAGELPAVGVGHRSRHAGYGLSDSRIARSRSTAWRSPVIVFFQLNDTSSSGQLFFQSSGGVGRTELSYDGTDFRTRVVPTIGTGSTLLDEFTSGLNDTDPHMWYFTSTSPSITVGSGSWGFDGNFTDFTTTGTDLSFDPGTLTVGGADFVDILVAHVLVFDYSLTPDEARDIFVASGLSPEPVATCRMDRGRRHHVGLGGARPQRRCGHRRLHPSQRRVAGHRHDTEPGPVHPRPRLSHRWCRRRCGPVTARSRSPRWKTLSTSSGKRSSTKPVSASSRCRWATPLRR